MSADDRTKEQGLDKPSLSALGENTDRVLRWVKLGWSKDRIIASLGGSVKRKDLVKFLDERRMLDKERVLDENSARESMGSAKPR